MIKDFNFSFPRPDNPPWQTCGKKLYY